MPNPVLGVGDTVIREIKALLAQSSQFCYVEMISRPRESRDFFIF